MAGRFVMYVNTCVWKFLVRYRRGEELEGGGVGGEPFAPPPPSLNPGHFVMCVCNSCTQVATFNDITGQSSDEDSYKALTALGILSAIQSLVKATFNQTEVRGGVAVGKAATLFSYFCKVSRIQKREGGAYS